MKALGLIISILLFAQSAMSDDTKQTARNLGLMNRDHNIWNRVSGGDINDYYRFSLNSRERVRFNIDQLQDNANMALYDDRGYLVKLSTNWGRSPDGFTVDINPGNYFLRVTAVMAHPQKVWSNTQYRLTINPSNAVPKDIGGKSFTQPFLAYQVYPTNGVPWTLREWLGHPGDSADYYQFGVGQGNSYQRFGARLSLNMNARLDLYERTTNYNQPWQHVATGYSSGAFNTDLKTTVKPGQYMLVVSYNGNYPVNYQLQMYTLMYYNQNAPF